VRSIIVFGRGLAIFAGAAAFVSTGLTGLAVTTGALALFSARLTGLAIFAGAAAFVNTGLTGLAVTTGALALFSARLTGLVATGLVAAGAATFGTAGLVAGLAHHGACGTMSFVHLHRHFNILLLKFRAVQVSFVLSLESEDNCFDDEEGYNYCRPYVTDSLQTVHPDLAVPTAGLEH
jgi:hypothetical protein